MKNLQIDTARRKQPSTLRPARSRFCRTATGQAIAEDTAFLVVLTAVAVLLLMLFINVFSILTIDTRLNFIASEVVRQRTENMYWLGLTRYDISQSAANTRAENLGMAIANASGIPVSSITVKQVDLPGTGGNFLGAECTITTT